MHLKSNRPIQNFAVAKNKKKVTGDFISEEFLIIRAEFFIE